MPPLPHLFRGPCSSWIVRAIRPRVSILSIKQATSINSRFLKYLFKVQQDNLDLEYGLFAPFSFKVVQNFIFSLFFSNFFLSFLDQSLTQPERRDLMDLSHIDFFFDLSQNKGCVSCSRFFRFVHKRIDQ